MVYPLSKVDLDAFPERTETGSGRQSLIGVFRTLVSEHRELTKLARRLARTSDPAVRAELFPRLRDQLVAHETAEAEVVYAAAQGDGLTLGMSERHDTSARALEVVVGCLSGYSFDNPQWQRTAETLLERFEQHVDVEEGRFFALVQQAVGVQRAEALDEIYLGFQARVRETQQREREI